MQQRSKTKESLFELDDSVTLLVHHPFRFASCKGVVVVKGRQDRIQELLMLAELQDSSVAQIPGKK